MKGGYSTWQMVRMLSPAVLSTLLTAIFFQFPMMVHGGSLLQELQPQEVIASYSGQPEYLDAIVDMIGDDCSDLMVQTTARLEVWNVGLEGGAQYGDARLEMSSPSFLKINDEPCQLKEMNVRVFYGTFSGGPNGTVTFNRYEILQGDSEDPEVGNITMQFINGTEVILKFENAPLLPLMVENPEAFEIIPTKQPTPTEGVDCSPDVHLPHGLKPGQVLSPSASFYDPDGNEVPTIQHRWYFNGAANNSVVWDGNEMKIELQYTCPNHRGDSEIIVFPAYSASPTPQIQTKSNQPLDQPETTPSIAQIDTPPATNAGKEIFGGVMVAAGTLGILISSVIGLAGIFSTPKAPPVSPSSVSASPPAGPQKAPTGTTGDKSGYKRDTFDDVHEAGDRLSGNIDEGSKFLGDIKDKIEMIPKIDDKTKNIILKPLQDCIDFADKTKEKVDQVLAPVSQVMNVRKNFRELDRNWKQNQQFGDEMRKDLQGLPEGTKNQITDLSRAIDGAGRVIEKALNYIPYYQASGGEKTWQVKKSFNEGARGVKKVMEGTHRTDIEMKKLGLDKEFGVKPSIYENPEYQKLQRQLKKNRPQQRGFLDDAWDFIVGKPTDPNVLKFR